MNAKLKAVLLGIIVFVILGGLWLFSLLKMRPILLLRNIPNALFLISFLAGVVMGLVGDKSGGLIAAIVSFIFITLIYCNLPSILKILGPIPVLLIGELGNILALTAVGFVSALIGQRLKLFWGKKKIAT